MKNSFRFWTHAALGLLLGMGANSCHPIQAFQLSPEFTESEKNLIDSDLQRLSSLQIQLPIYSSDESESREAIGAQFLLTAMFGGTDTASILRYLDDRIQLVLAPQFEMDELIYVNQADENSLIRTLSMASGTQAEQKKSKSLAVNYSLSLLLSQAMNPQRPLYVKTPAGFMPIESSRIGVVQLKEAFFEPLVANGNSKDFALYRSSVLIHEARHSDCPGGVNADALVKRFQTSEADLNLQSPEDLSCGHLHVKCPKDHDLAGIYACDQIPWGPYMIDMYYNLAIYKYCQNCSARERQSALMMSNDSYTRLLFDPEKASRPNMTSGKLRFEASGN